MLKIFFVGWSRSGILDADPRSIYFPQAFMPSKLRWLTRGIVMDSDFSDFMISCSVYFICMVSSSTFYPHFMSSGVFHCLLCWPQFFVLIPLFFCLGWR